MLLHSGARNEANAALLYELFHRTHFRISVTKDAATVEVCGAIKVRNNFTHIHVHMYTVQQLCAPYRC